MKKKTLLTLILCAISVAALRVGDPSNSGDQAATGIAYLIAIPAFEFSDLDARDAFNEPIKEADGTSNLAALFRENLVNLRVFAEPHYITQTIDWLESISSLINKHIYSRARAYFCWIIDAILFPNRRFVHNVHNLWITPIVDVSSSNLQNASHGEVQSVNWTPLRC